MKERHAGFKLLDMFTRMQQEYPEFTPDKILIIDVKLMKKIVTPSRVELIEAIRNHKPKSVNDLARIVNRPQESVSRDLTILNNYGVLEFVQVGKTRRPVIDKEIFAVTC
jgi:predicted transcriptional regulator